MTPPRPVRFILIAGPTASGKSRLALALARRFGGAVANVDASQVYADLRVLTARPTEPDLQAAPHLLYGHRDAAQPYAVGQWLEDVHRLVPSLRTGRSAGDPQSDGAGPARGHRPGPLIFAGGTGLYFEALTRGLAPVPDIPDPVRARWRSFGPAAALHAELARRDPRMAARLRPSDPQRLMRALEVIDATGRSLADWQADAADPPIDPADCLKLVLSPPRAALDAVIARRLDGMMAEGAVEEAARLAARGLDPALPAMKAVGLRPLAAFARGALSRTEAVERVRLDTRRYAKRQSTWFRNRMADWLHLSPEAAEDAVLREIEARGLTDGA